ncbi:hypothetical protein ACFFX1_41370 [Dactylosporangium sucinum]|uniref:Uncharacterized protein n=1 Tax=Dactylosporangium sucinum TaxID=1424081 RepID=A0A917UG38_9ACTN|nr:hypothetical protein [Dactylosporangium sucinum]GGM90274.1 hypothetical protein GCM10007977_110380 [Dactylosporangium sucinum]
MDKRGGGIAGAAIVVAVLACWAWQIWSPNASANDKAKEACELFAKVVNDAPNHPNLRYAASDLAKAASLANEAKDLGHEAADTAVAVQKTNYTLLARDMADLADAVKSGGDHRDAAKRVLAECEPYIGSGG